MEIFAISVDNCLFKAVFGVNFVIDHMSNQLFELFWFGLAQLFKPHTNDICEDLQI